MDALCDNLPPVFAAFFGMVPSLIYSSKRDMSGIMQRFDDVYNLVGGTRILSTDVKTLGRFVHCVLSGDLIETIEAAYPFAIFSSVIHSRYPHDQRKVSMEWPICYIGFILRKFRFIDDLTIPRIIESIPLFGNKLGAGFDWELVVSLAIELRAADAALNEARGPFDIAIQRTSSRMFVKSMDLPLQCESLSQARIYIRNVVWQSFVRKRCEILIFSPLYACFPDYDGFVVFIDPNKMESVGAQDADTLFRSTEVIGHQHKLCRVDPANSPPSWIKRSILLRGRVPERENKMRGWEYWNRQQVMDLLGHSLRRLYPENWPQIPLAADMPLLEAYMQFQTEDIANID
jgi:hypothetical protein